MADPKRILGDAGEDLVARTLAKRGWQIVARNARTRYGEIDLICHDGRAYVFVEVKTRRASSFVSATEAAGPRKVRRLELLAQAWLAMRRARASPWRITVAAVTVSPSATELDLVDVVG